MNGKTACDTIAEIIDEPKSFKMDEHSMHTLRAAMKELLMDVVRKLSTPLFKYFVSLYRTCADEVINGTAPWEGDFADLRWYQDKLKAIPTWNMDTIKKETRKILTDVGDWPASDIIGTVLYIKAMILASIRPIDMKDDVFIPIASIETYLHTCMRIVAKKLFAHPSVVRKFPDDDEELINRNSDRIIEYITFAINSAIIDLTPTAEIVQKYVRQVLSNVQRKTETGPRAMDESEKYGFEETLDEDHDTSDVEYSEYSTAGSESEHDVEPEPERKHRHRDREEKKAPLPPLPCHPKPNPRPKMTDDVVIPVKDNK